MRTPLFSNLAASAGVFVFGLLFAASASADFRFSVAADPRDYSGVDHHTLDYFYGVCLAIVAEGSGDFLISPGDVDHDPPPGGPADVYWTIEQSLGPGFLWYPGVGNHEAETASDMDWMRDWNPGGNSLPYVVNVGPGGPGPSGSEETTYSFDYGDVHFVQINQYYDGSNDAGSDGDVADELYYWLDADLNATSQPLILVFGHEPAWPQPDADNGRPRHIGDSLDAHPQNRDRFWSLLREHQVTAFLHGHAHNFSAVNIDGVWQIDTGHARGVGETGALSTFLMVDVVGDTVTYQAFRGEGSGGVYTLSYSDLIACDACETGVFQDGVFPDAGYSDSRDTYIESGSPHGGDTPLVVDGSPDNAAILEWDVSTIPAGSTVLRAWITLNIRDTSNVDIYEIYEMKRDWVESEANWNDYASGASWEVAGASGANDRGSTVLGEVVARSDYSDNYILSLNGDGIALVQSWINSPAGNHGVIITDYSESDSVQFDSRESSTAEYRPKLTIWYQNAADPCGDGTQDPGEDCDDGNTNDGDCCSSTCHYESSSTMCRAAAGACDVPDYCDGMGSCTVDTFEPVTTECRSVADACDVAEMCTGSGASCPADAWRPTTKECRTAAGFCDLPEVTCPPVVRQCPADEKRTVECRAMAGACDVAEVCDGVSNDCPADAVEPPTTLCRGAAGVCDAPDYCDGASASCTEDAKLTSECRASTGVCDVSEMCDGVADDCPADSVLDGVPCPDDDLCNGNEMCEAGTCVAGTPLLCDDADVCTADSCDPVSGCVNEPIEGCGMIPAPSASPAGRLLLSLLVLAAGATFLARRRRFGA